MKVLPIVFGLLVGVIAWKVVGAWGGIAAAALGLWAAYVLLNKPPKR